MYSFVLATRQVSESSEKEVPKNVRPPSPPSLGVEVLLPPLTLRPPLVAASPVCGLHTHYSLHTGQVREGVKKKNVPFSSLLLLRGGGGAPGPLRRKKL